jgi:hypothetical protein
MKDAIATYTKLPDGTWGIRARQPLEAGASVALQGKNGQVRSVIVGEEVVEEYWAPGVRVYRIKAEPKKQGAGSGKAKCWFAGTAQCGGCPHCRLRERSANGEQRRTSEEERISNDEQGMTKAEGGKQELTIEEACKQMERVGSAKELLAWMRDNRARLGGCMKLATEWFNVRMGRFRAEAGERVSNKPRTRKGMRNESSACG